VRRFTRGESIEEGGDQLRDNAWLVQAARADYPARVVAYDRDDLIIGIQTMEGDVREGGRTGEARVARSSDGGRWFRDPAAERRRR
jgi:hypothetical protein